MKGVIDTIRAVVRDEMARSRMTELARVTAVHPKTSDSAPDNHQVDAVLLESGLELPRVPVAVPRIGWSALPKVDDLVVVVYVGGNLNAPLVLGCVYDDKVHPPVAEENEVVYQPPEDEASGVRRLHLELPGGATVTLEDETLSIVFGGTSVTVKKDGDVDISAKGNIQLSSEGDVKISAQGAVKVEAQSDLALSGLSAKVEGSAEAKLKGGAVSIAGTTQFSPS